MNKLGFADFHAKHFNQEQQAYWKSLLQQQQFYNENLEEQPIYNTNDQHDRDYQNYQSQGIEESKYMQDAEESFEDYPFSKEAMEIFEFSESYRKERKAEKLREEEEEELGKKDWKFDESSVLYSGGVEAPATCLVLTKPFEKKPEILRMKEDVLNSAYISSCVNKDENTPVLLWPVIPFRL